MIGLLASIKAGITTLTGRLTSGRATALDYLDVSVNSRAPSSTALSNAVWDATLKSYIQGIPQTQINSIQQGSVSVSSVAESGSSSNTATISSVTTSKAICLLSGHTSTKADGYAAVELTNATTVTAYVRNQGVGTATIVAYFTVIEFK